MSPQNCSVQLVVSAMDHIAVQQTSAKLQVNEEIWGYSRAWRQKRSI